MESKSICAICGRQHAFMRYAANLCLECGDRLQSNPEAARTVANLIDSLRGKIAEAEGLHEMGLIEVTDKDLQSVHFMPGRVLGDEHYALHVTARAPNQSDITVRMNARQVSRLFRVAMAEVQHQLAAANERAEKLQAFKDWVHAYLDSKGIPHHPPGTHGAEGCRIGDRMDYVFAAKEKAEQKAATAVQDFIHGRNKLCLICGAKEPCELKNDPMSPCTFDPTPMELLDGYQKIAAEKDKAERERDALNKRADAANAAECCLNSLAYMLGWMNGVPPQETLERDVRGLLVRCADSAKQRDEARAIAAEGRRAGRAEAARILMEQDAETFPGDSSPDAKNAVVLNQEIGISGDYATRWDEEKVRALFELGKERTAFDDFADRVESESWDQVGLQLELDMARQERDALKAKLSDHGPDGHNVTNLQYVNERDENARLRGQVAGLLFILKNCESVFREYAQIHEMKLTPEGTRKAAANRAHADHIAKVLAGYAAPAPDAKERKGGEG